MEKKVNPLLCKFNFHVGGLNDVAIHFANVGEAGWGGGDTIGGKTKFILKSKHEDFSFDAKKQ